jgi:phenylalanyl-tRNA synthetase beta chain
MRISLTWLQQFVEWDGQASELASILIRNGIEVEMIEEVGIRSESIVVARVLDVHPHPSADRLRVCTVFDGSGERRVVCGAHNVAPNQLVVLALPGSRLDGDVVIETRTIRGVVSEGMICSERELGLGDDHSGILVLDGYAEPGTPLSTLYPPDTIIEIGITPNRGDALSHVGVARIVAAALGRRIELPTVSIGDRFPIAPAVEISQPELCRRYAACILDGVKPIPSPRWIALRLERAGIRPRNIIVDATNYVMLECGHPLHAFDYDRLDGRTIVVRTARDGESIVTLDGIERRLDTSMLCICDANKPQAIAGVMGGADSAITASTQRVLLESAHFLPASVRRTSRKLGLHTDASYRFERGADIEMIPYALDRAAAIIAEVTGARVSEITDRYPHPQKTTPITLRFERIQRVLGVHVAPDRIVHLLDQRGFHADSVRLDSIAVHVPSYRTDVQAECDLVEEVAIAVGYDEIPPSSNAIVPFAARSIPERLRFSDVENDIRRWLAAIGFHEALSYTLQDPNTAHELASVVEIANALGRDRSVLRQWMLPTMVENISRNARYGVRSIRLFEIGKVFRLSENVAAPVTEERRLVLAVAGNTHARHWLDPARELDIFDLKGVVAELLSRYRLHVHWRVAEGTPSLRSWLCDPIIELVLGDHVIGYVAQLDRKRAEQYDMPDNTFVAELVIETLLCQPRTARRYIPPSNYPSIVRDIALVVPCSVMSNDLVQTISAAGGEHLRSVEPFDVFEHPSLGPGSKSIAFALSFGSTERTLTDEEIDAALARILDAVAREHNARLRTV